jgi:hypothetical protein
LGERQASSLVEAQPRRCGYCWCLLDTWRVSEKEGTLNTRYDVTIPWNDASSYNGENLIRRCSSTSVVVYNDDKLASLSSEPH